MGEREEGEEDIFCLMFFKDRTIVLICQGGKRRKKEILFPGYPTNMSEKSLDLAPHNDYTIKIGD
jgi:hypothetical protein